MTTAVLSLSVGRVDAQIPARLMSSNEAVQMALADAETLPRDVVRHVRYVWNQRGRLERVKVISLVANLNSREGIVVRPIPIADGKLLRLDMRMYARPHDWAEYRDLWDEFQFDPAFSLLIPGDAVREHHHDMTGMIRRWELVPSAPYTEDGQTFRERWRVVTEKGRLGDVKDVILFRTDPDDIDPIAFDRLRALTHSAAPIVEHRYYLFRSLTANQDGDLFKAIWGGLYYEFNAIRKAKRGEGTDEDVLFRSLGIGSKDEAAEKVYARLGSGQRVAMLRSGVTSFQRRADYGALLSARISTVYPFWSITHDVGKEDVNIAQSPLYNLRNFKDRARELLYHKANGLQGGALFNDKGALQRSVPPNVAGDRTIPEPHPPVLEPIYSCIACHWGRGHGGWQPLRNDVTRLLKTGRRDILGDRTGDEGVVQELAGLYAGDPDDPLRLARASLARAVLDATGPWPGGGTQVDIVRLAADELGSAWREYWYDEVDAKAALADLGWDVPGVLALPVLALLLPPDVRAADGGEVPEDGILALLLSGSGVNRADWAKSQGFAGGRAGRAYRALLQRN